MHLRRPDGLQCGGLRDIVISPEQTCPGPLNRAQAERDTQAREPSVISARVVDELARRVGPRAAVGSAGAQAIRVRPSSRLPPEHNACSDFDHQRSSRAPRPSLHRDATRTDRVGVQAKARTVRSSPLARAHAPTGRRHVQHDPPSCRGPVSTAARRPSRRPRDDRARYADPAGTLERPRPARGERVALRILSPGRRGAP